KSAPYIPTPNTDAHPRSLHDALPIFAEDVRRETRQAHERAGEVFVALATVIDPRALEDRLRITPGLRASDERWLPVELAGERLVDRKSTRLNSSHQISSYAVFCLHE